MIQVHPISLKNQCDDLFSRTGYLYEFDSKFIQPFWGFPTIIPDHLYTFYLIAFHGCLLNFEVVKGSEV